MTGRVLAIAVLSTAALLAACGGAREPQRPAAAPPPSTFDEALGLARRRQTQVVVHFRLPGRPVSDAMDTALPPAVLATLAADVVHLRLDARGAVDLCQRLCGTSQRSGPGLATCIVDPAAPDDALAVHRGYLDQAGLRRLLAEAAALREELARCDTDAAQHALVLADHLARCGHRVRARTLLAKALVAADEAHRSDEAEGTTRSTCAARLARLAIEDGDLVATRAWLRSAGAGAHATLTRAMLHLAAREARQALPLLSALEQTGNALAPGERGRVLLHLARAWHECGQDSEALGTLARLTRQCPNTDAAARAEQEAAHIRANDHGHSHTTPP
ncbi:MAG: hypothetical protein R3F56_07410 [Planctomycetota bacterium]